MPVTHIRWWRYAIPFRTPFVTAHGTLLQREGIVLQLLEAGGLHGMGEIAPLPGFGGSLDAQWRLLPSVAEGLAGLRVVTGGNMTGEGQRWAGLPAALRCGIETALLDLAGQEVGCSLAALLGPQPATVVPVNATISAGDTAVAAEHAAEAVAAGFGTVKLKVGLWASVTAEVTRVAAVRAAVGPAVQLRLDANEAWTPDEAIAVIQACAPFQPEWVEQPVAAADVAGLARVRRAVGTPIAADESVTGEQAVQSLLSARAADVLIIKPTVVGGPGAAARLFTLAQAAGVGAIVTSTLEAGVGLAAAAHAAAVLPLPRRACGLATAALLEDDLLRQPLRIEGGLLHRPTDPGLGVHLDWDRLERYTTARGELAVG